MEKEKENKKLKEENFLLRSKVRALLDKENEEYHQREVLKAKVLEAQERARRFHRRAQRAEADFMKVYGDVEREEWARKLKKSESWVQFYRDRQKYDWDRLNQANEKIRTLQEQIKELKENNVVNLKKETA